MQVQIYRMGAGRRQSIRIGQKNLCFFPVAYHCPAYEDYGEANQRNQFGFQRPHVASFEINRAHNLNKISQRIENGDGLRPCGHTAHGRKNAAHQNHNDCKKEHDEHCLLHIGRMIGNNQSETGKNQHKYHGKQINGGDTSHRHKSVYERRQPETDGEHAKTDNPVGNQLCQNEDKFAYRRYVYLFDGAFFLFAHNVERRQKSAQNGEQNHHQRRNNIGFVIEIWVESILRNNFDNAAAALTLSAEFAADFGRKIADNPRQIAAAKPAFCAVHRVGDYHHFGAFFFYQIAFETMRNFQNNIRFAALHTFYRLPVSIGHMRDAEISRRRRFVYQPFRIRAMVVVDYAQVDIFHIQTGHPRKNQHNQHRKHHNQFGQKRIPLYLLKLFLYQIFNHGYCNLILNFFKLIKMSSAAIETSIATSFSTNEISNP